MRFKNNDDMTSILTLYATTDEATFSGNMVAPSLNGYKIGAPSSFAFDSEAPFIPVVGSDGETEKGKRIDFHRASTEDDYQVSLEAVALIGHPLDIIIQHMLVILNWSLPTTETLVVHEFYFPIHHPISYGTIMLE